MVLRIQVSKVFFYLAVFALERAINVIVVVEIPSW